MLESEVEFIEKLSKYAETFNKDEDRIEYCFFIVYIFLNDLDEIFKELSSPVDDYSI